jgi:hypothetical protein
MPCQTFGLFSYVPVSFFRVISVNIQGCTWKGYKHSPFLSLNYFNQTQKLAKYKTKIEKTFRGWWWEDPRRKIFWSLEYWNAFSLKIKYLKHQWILELQRLSHCKQLPKQWMFKNSIILKIVSVFPAWIISLWYMGYLQLFYGCLYYKSGH